MRTSRAFVVWAVGTALWLCAGGVAGAATSRGPVRAVAGAVPVALKRTAVAPRSVVRLPDLAVASVILDARGALVVGVKNAGEAALGLDKGMLRVDVDGTQRLLVPLKVALGMAALAPGGSAPYQTGLRLCAGPHRVAIWLDPDQAVAESDEFHNQWTGTLTMAGIQGPDFAVRDLTLGADGRVKVLLGNVGCVGSPPGRQARVLVWADGQPSTDKVVTLPSMAAGATLEVLSDPPIVMRASGRVRARVATVDPLAEIDHANDELVRYLPQAGYAAYEAVFATPKVAAAAVWEDGTGAKPLGQWTPAQRQQLYVFARRYEEGAPLPQAAPPTLTDGRFPAAAAWNIYLAHLAHHLWLEVRGLVPWRLASLPADQLAVLLDGRQLFAFDAPRGAYSFRGASTDADPRVGYRFMVSLGLLRPTGVATLHALTDWARGHLRHITGACDSPNFTTVYGYPGPPPVERILFPVPEAKHTAPGCHGTAALFCSLFRSVNLAAPSVIVDLDGAHARPTFPFAGLTLGHADDPYNSWFRPSGTAAPVEKLLMTEVECQQLLVAPAALDRSADGTRTNTRSEQAGYNHTRRSILLGAQYLPDHALLKAGRERAAFEKDLIGFKHGETTQQYAKPFLSPAERASFLAALDEKLLQLGDGDAARGLQMVDERHDRFVGTR